ncbi:hypothetical protein OFM15_28820, partial [Escherichia coli]|nr:hypothetical protein [Escherichia coli]
NNNSGSQARFLIAAALSMVVLFAWSYFFAPKKPVDNTNQPIAAENPANTQTTPGQTALTESAKDQAAQEIASLPDNEPNRKIVIKSPLYEV